MIIDKFIIAWDNIITCKKIKDNPTRVGLTEYKIHQLIHQPAKMFWNRNWNFFKQKN